MTDSRLVLVSVLASVLAACSGGAGGGEGATCSDNGDCDDGLTCVDGECNASTVDGGTPDASDGGGSDAGPSDAGPSDAGTDAGGAGAGETCTVDAGDCRPGLKCENGVCCEDSGAPCCTADTAGDVCSDGLGCDTERDEPSFTCFESCTPDTDERCVSADRYCGSDGTSCTDKLDTGVPCDADVQCSSGRCVEGECKVDNGGPCTLPAECASGNCECADAACSSRTCSETACPTCEYNSDADDTCDGYVDYGVPCSTPLICNGAGQCLLENEQPCTGDGVCASDNCECASSDCDLMHCTQQDCGPCEYSPNGMTCSGQLDTNTSCGSGRRCDSSGNCLAVGTCSCNCACQNIEPGPPYCEFCAPLVDSNGCTNGASPLTPSCGGSAPACATDPCTCECRF